MSVNEKDRHVLALAVHVGAPILVTNSLKDFPPKACEPLGIEAMTADAFLCLQVDLDPPLLRQAFAEMAARRRRHPTNGHRDPPPTRSDTLHDRLSRP